MPPVFLAITRAEYHDPIHKKILHSALARRVQMPSTKAIMVACTLLFGAVQTTAASTGPLDPAQTSVTGGDWHVAGPLELDDQSHLVAFLTSSARLRITTEGPIWITADLTVPAGSTLVLQSAEAILLQQGARLKGGDGASPPPVVAVGAPAMAVGERGGDGGSFILIAPHVRLEGATIPGDGGDGAVAIGLAGASARGGNGGNAGYAIAIENGVTRLLASGVPGDGGMAVASSDCTPDILQPILGLPCGVPCTASDHTCGDLPNGSDLPDLPDPGDLPSDPEIGPLDPAALTALNVAGCEEDEMTATGGDGGASLARGGRGADAVVDASGCGGTTGSNGVNGSGPTDCSGTSGGPGGVGVKAVATGGNGGPGGVTGGDGGSAKAQGGKGGMGGNGGNGWSFLVVSCAGGNGGPGGTGGAADAQGGNGGKGNCGGGTGGRASARGGDGGTGGTGGVAGGGPGNTGSAGQASQTPGGTGGSTLSCGPVQA